MQDSKAMMRKQFRALRREVLYKDRAAEGLQKNCKDFFQLGKREKILSGYIPMDGEIDILPFMRYVSSKSIPVMIPKVEEDSKLLKFIKWEECNNELCTDNAIPNAIIVPLVAFDKALNRLGFGGGYYDYTIEFFRKNYSDCRFFGVAYEIQLCEHVPVYEHDQKLDAIITDKSVYT